MKKFFFAIFEANMKNCKIKNTNIEDFKIKKIPADKMLINIDRLTRFKHPQIKYLRVFEDLINEYLIFPQIKKTDIENMDYKELTHICENIINYSLENNSENDYSINKKIFEYENTIYKIDEPTNIFLNNKINYKSILKYINADCPKNLRWLKSLAQNTEIKDIRKKQGFLYPIEKVVITEGATEEILLPVFAKLYNFNFDKNGIKLISAGGKNQVVKLYYNLADTLKIPIFVLLDKDAQENKNEISHKLRNIDKIHILKCGEFEDLLTPELIKKTLCEELKNISILDAEQYEQNIPTTEFLEGVFKNKGYHEFKKVEFAQMIKRNISSINEIKPEILEILEEIIAK